MNQRQNDVYGELLSAVYRFRDQLAGALDLQTKLFLAGLADQAAAKWRAPDRGIWEVRGEARHFVHSKLMCWVALDRAVRLAELLEAEPRVAQWSATRDQIRDEILRRGWSDRAQAFTQSFDSDELDAAVLNMPLVGFIAADDPRMRITIDAIVNRLTDERGLVYRYRAPDGLSGEEGTFLLCTFWLAEALALAGEIERAKEAFTRAAAFANDLGLLAEEVDPRSGELLGNFPQAFSHIGLINAAAAIAKASATRGGDEKPARTLSST